MVVYHENSWSFSSHMNVINENSWSFSSQMVVYYETADPLAPTWLFIMKTADPFAPWLFNHENSWSFYLPHGCLSWKQLILLSSTWLFVMKTADPFISHMIVIYYNIWSFSSHMIVYHENSWLCWGCIKVLVKSNWNFPPTLWELSFPTVFFFITIYLIIIQLPQKLHLKGQWVVRQLESELE